MPDDQSPRICLFGAAPDTGNLGVSALWHSAVSGIARRAPGVDLTVFDDGRTLRAGKIQVDGADFQFHYLGASNSRRFYRPDCLWNMSVCSALGGLGNSRIQRIKRADAVLDVTGGDSFTDMYGERRFKGVTTEKGITLRQGTRLILLPQTYGPYRSASNKAIASRIVCEARMAWARDPRMFKALRELAGDGFDPEIHKEGVDMAFALDRIEPRKPIPETIAGWLDDENTPVLGINVSGLCYNNLEQARQQFGLSADYRNVINGLVERLLRETDARILLVPHVLTPDGDFESDSFAAHAVVSRLDTADKARVEVLPEDYDQCEIKWIIARLSWFCGTRMHATIAALSTGVPTAAMAYSLKTQGVFETCGQGAAVADLRSLSSDEMLEHVWRTFVDRETARESLKTKMSEVVGRANQQMDEIIAACRG